MFAVVSPDDAKEVPYPFVYVNDDGTARELHAAERAYLETEFHGADGARPYIKTSYDKRDGWKSVAGYMLRRLLPAGLAVGPAPAEDPNKPMTPDQMTAFLESKGLVAEKEPDGTIRMMKRKPSA